MKEQAPDRTAVRRSLERVSETTWLPHDEYVTSTGTRIIHLQQYFRGLRVYRSARVVSVRRGLGRRVSPARRVSIPRSTPTVPVIPAASAANACVAFLRRRGAIPRSLHLRIAGAQAFNLLEAPTVLDCGRAFAEPIRAHLEVFPAPARRSRLAWVFDVAPKGGRRCQVVVSADRKRPAVLFSTQTASCLDFQARWIPFPGDVPVSRQFPGRWLDQQGTAAGPSTSCHRGSTQAPSALGQDEFDNPFVWSNYLHDFFAAFGFDRSLGAFDSGEDPLVVQVYLRSRSDRGGQFDNQVDGVSPVMKLFDTRYANGQHAALDPSILVHEYTHGVTNRLVGGAAQPSPFHGREGQGLNEGYSDYFALTVSSFVDRGAGGTRPGLLQIGPAFRPGGVRDYTGFSRGLTSSVTDIYDLAMVWCGGLLAARSQVAGLPGVSLDDADRFLWQALLDSLRAMAPACPGGDCLTFSHAKDALLTESRLIEQRLASLQGATAAIDGALAGRGIV